MLLERGADFIMEDFEGHAAIWWTTWLQEKEMYRILVDCAAVLWKWCLVGPRRLVVQSMKHAHCLPQFILFHSAWVIPLLTLVPYNTAMVYSNPMEPYLSLSPGRPTYPHYQYEHLHKHHVSRRPNHLRVRLQQGSRTLCDLANNPCTSSALRAWQHSVMWCGLLYQPLSHSWLKDPFFIWSGFPLEKWWYSATVCLLLYIQEISCQNDFSIFIANRLHQFSMTSSSLPPFIFYTNIYIYIRTLDICSSSLSRITSSSTFHRQTPDDHL